jgi:hypothetical protein
MTTLNALVERIQVEDLGRRTPIRRGATMTAQLVMRGGMPPLQALLSANEEFFRNYAGHFAEEFISQPARGSPLTQVLGRVLHAHVGELKPSRQFPEGRSWTEILMTAEDVPFVAVVHRDRGSEVRIPSRSDILHLCGVLECELSFTILRTFCPIQARVERAWRFDAGLNEEEGYWGIIRFELASGLRKTDMTVVNSLGQTPYPYHFRG